MEWPLSKTLTSSVARMGGLPILHGMWLGVTAGYFTGESSVPSIFAQMPCLLPDHCFKNSEASLPGDELQGTWDVFVQSSRWASRIVCATKDGFHGLWWASMAFSCHTGASLNDFKLHLQMWKLRLNGGVHVASKYMEQGSTWTLERVYLQSLSTEPQCLNILASVLSAAYIICNLSSS